MIFPRIIELDLKQSYKYRTILGKFAVVYTRTRFSILSGTCLNVKFLPKLRKDYKNIVFRPTTDSHCTLMADSIRVA